MQAADSNQSLPTAEKNVVTGNSTASYHRHPHHPTENGVAAATYNTFDEISLNSNPTPLSTLHSGGKAGKRYFKPSSVTFRIFGRRFGLNELSAGTGRPDWALVELI
jgi:hypothetical protein